MKTSLLLIISLTLVASCSREVKTPSGTEVYTQKLQEMQSTAAAIYQKDNNADQNAHNHFLALTDERQDLGSKIISASKYFKSMEFQFWGGTKTPSNIKSINQMYDEAAIDITGRLFGIYKELDIKDISPKHDDQKHNEELSFYSLAATMDEKTGKISFQDLLKKALLNELNGKTLQSHEETLTSLSNKEMMIELIKARVDIMAALALKELTLGQKSKSMLDRVFSSDRSNSPTPSENLDKANDATKIKILKFLEAAVSSKNFLKETGIQKDLKDYLKKAFKKMDLTQPQSANTVKDEKKESIRIAITNLLE